MHIIFNATQDCSCHCRQTVWCDSAASNCQVSSGCTNGLSVLWDMVQSTGMKMANVTVGTKGSDTSSEIVFRFDSFPGQNEWI